MGRRIICRERRGATLAGESEGGGEMRNTERDVGTTLEER